MEVERAVPAVEQLGGHDLAVVGEDDRVAGSSASDVARWPSGRRSRARLAGRRGRARAPASSTGVGVSIWRRARRVAAAR